MPTTPGRNGDDKMIAVAFVYFFPRSSYMPSFIEQDYRVLSNHFDCGMVNFRGLKDVRKLIKLILRSDISFSWFASGHSLAAVLLSMLFGKKSVVVAGGYDVAYEPEINYGQYTLGWRRRVRADFVLKHANRVLAVSEFTRAEALMHARAASGRVEVVYNAVDTDMFHPGDEENRENLVVTVASGLGDVIRLKGLDAFLKAAELLPEVKFMILGLSDDNIEILNDLSPPRNAELRGYMGQEELISYYRKAKVCCQLSYRESFGIALAEAMACGCVPVATDRGALPEVVGDTGFFVPYEDPESTVEAIKEALKSDNGPSARERVKNMFSSEQREKKLVNIIQNLTK